MQDFILTHQWLIWVILILALWDSIWKMVAMWKAARNNQMGWFILIAFLNTLGIFPMIYIAYLQKKKE